MQMIAVGLTSFLKMQSHSIPIDKITLQALGPPKVFKQVSKKIKQFGHIFAGLLLMYEQCAN